MFKHTWFRLNKWKTGWAPISWQGWLLIMIFWSIVIYNFIRIDATSHSVSDTLLNFVPETLLFAGILSVICYFTSDRTSDNEMLQ